MKKRFNKIFFYILLTCFSFFDSILNKTNAAISLAYWIVRPPEPEPKIPILWVLVDFLLLGVSFILAPIIFLIWLYLFITKKTSKIKKDKWKNYIFFAFVILLFSEILRPILNNIINENAF